MATPTSSPIDINKASFEDLLSINGIGEKRAKSIIAQRKIKGKLTLEDLKVIPNIPSTLWDPLLDQGIIKIDSSLKQKQETQQLETETNTVPSTNTSTNTQVQMSERNLEQDNEKELVCEEHVKEIRKRDELISELEKEIQKRESVIEELQGECTVLRRRLDKNTESSIRLKEEMEVEIQMRENEMLQKFVDEKEKIRLLDERERQEHEEKFRKKLRELEAREKEIDKKVREFSARERELDKREKELDQLEHRKLSSNIDKTAPHNIYTSKTQTTVDRNSPAPPKLSTYDGKSEWRPYLIQFNHIAKKYNWSDSEKLDRLIECLRDKALKYFSSRSEMVQSNFNQLCQQMKERFDKKDQPHIIRRQLQEIKQNPEETIEEFVERIEDLATEGYEGIPEYFKNTDTIDAFLRGCTEKRAALVTLDKDPKTLEEAMQYMKSAITNQKLIGGIKKEVKRVTFDEVDESSPEKLSIRRTNIRTPSPPSSNTGTLENRITRLEEEQQEHTKLLKEIIRSLKDPERRTGSRSPEKEPRQYRSPSPSRSESSSECFKCGKMGHYARNCLKPRSPSPPSHSLLSPKKSLNFQQLKK